MGKEGPGVMLWLLEHYGLAGLLIAFLAGWLFLKDRQLTKLHEEMAKLHEQYAKELRDERDARIEDAKAGTELLLKIQSVTSETVQKLHTMFEALKMRIR